MCGRINFKIDRETKLKLLELGISPKDVPDDLPPGFNIAPTEPIPVVYEWEQKRTFHFMRWWLHPHWSKDQPNQKYAMFNARLETLDSSKAFKGPFQYRRCIVPVSSFIEWKHEDGRKQPYLLEAEEGPLLLAGIWDIWQEELLSCAIITQPADAHFHTIHDRMPIALTLEEAEHWLNHKQEPEEALKAVIGARVALTATPVGTDINNAKNKSEPLRAGTPIAIHSVTQ